MSVVERRQRNRSRTDGRSKRTAVYVDYNEDTSKRSGIFVDTERRKVPNMDDRADERTPLLQEKQRLEDEIIAKINRVDAQVDTLLPQAENLAAATGQYFGEDKKVSPKKKSLWKQLCFCCCLN